MNYVKMLVQLVWYYKTDEMGGKPYWKDPAFIGLAVSLVGAILTHYAGISIDADTQLKIAGAIVGIGVAVSPHTGVVKAPSQQAAEAAKAVQEHNLSSLS